MVSDKLSFIVERIDEGRIRVEVNFVDDGLCISLGILYFERAKRSFNRKPVGMDAWLCVDAKVEGLYERDNTTTPQQIVARCYDEIRRAGY
jgi:hypothetical protein